MTNKSTMLLEHNLKQLKLPTFLREYDKLASQCASYQNSSLSRSWMISGQGADHPDYLLRLSELELIDRHHRMVEQVIRNWQSVRGVSGSLESPLLFTAYAELLPDPLDPANTHPNAMLRQIAL